MQIGSLCTCPPVTRHVRFSFRLKNSIPSNSCKESNNLRYQRHQNNFFFCTGLNIPFSKALVACSAVDENHIPLPTVGSLSHGFGSGTSFVPLSRWTSVAQLTWELSPKFSNSSLHAEEEAPDISELSEDLQLNSCQVLIYKQENMSQLMTKKRDCSRRHLLSNGSIEARWTWRMG